MLKLTALLLSFTLFVTGTMHAQTVASSNQNPPDLKEAIARQTEEIKNESGVIDAEKMEKAARQTPRKPSSRKNKLLLVGLIAGFVALGIVLAFTIKKCARYNTPGCDVNDVFNCQCVEYAE